MTRASAACVCILVAVAPSARGDPATLPSAASFDPPPRALAQVPDPWLGGAIRLVGAPYARYSPETAWAFGAASFLWFHADPATRATGRASSVGASLQHTLRGQTSASAIWDLYLSEGNVRTDGAFCDERWPSELWAPGMASGARGETYTPRSIKAEVRLAARTVDAGEGRGLWLGLQMRGRTDALDRLDPGGLLERCAVTGCRGGRVLSLAATAAWDTRDHVFSAERGLLLSARAGPAVASLGGPGGGSSTFVEGDLDARAWLPLPLRRGARMTLQARLQLASGNVPFYMLSTFGGEHSLRGVLEGRWRDQTALSFQAEHVMPLFWRLGVGVFGGVGQAAPRPSALAWERFVPAGGAGLRVTVDRADRVILRIDRGVSRESANWYLSIGEAI